jgi:hypothetical protein
MVEIAKNLYIGSQDDYELNVKFQTDWFVIHACKEPYHRQALGYTGRAVANLKIKWGLLFLALFMISILVHNA